MTVNMTRHRDSVEVVLKDQRRRRWSPGEKAALVRRTYEPGMSVSLVARQEGVAASLLFQQRKLERQCALTAVSAGEAFVPASELAAARAENPEAAVHPGQEDPGEQNPERSGGVLGRKKWMARSHPQALKIRSAIWSDGRRRRTPTGDEKLVDDIRRHIGEHPNYGYRRAFALLNRERAAAGHPRVNPKRVYRVMAAHGLLVPRAPKRRESSRRHDGTVAVAKSNQRWFRKAYRSCREALRQRGCAAGRRGIPHRQRWRLHRRRHQAHRPKLGPHTDQYTGVQPAE